MRDRHIQMRLLWELQSHFLDLLPEEGVSPERHEAIILCLISFPVVNFTVRENENCVLSSVTNRDGVCIEVQERTSIAHISISVPHGPQLVHVAVSIRSVGQGHIKLSAAVSGEGSFIWEDWRNGFSACLAVVSKWQKRNGLECVPLLQTERSIGYGVRSARVVAFGTGKNLNVWLGWLPHRESLCLFEVTLPDFIDQVTKDKLDEEHTSTHRALSRLTRLVQSRHVPVKYSTAKRLDLEHASVVSHKV